MKATLLTLFIGFALTTLKAQQPAVGVVFHDENANAKRDKHEKGIPNIFVSNGVEVVSTDNQGRYEIGINPDQILFVIKPKGWMPPVNEWNLPQFFYIHKPSGSPKLEIPGSLPTGRLPNSIDFPLYRSEEPSEFEVFIFGDPQPRNKKHIQYLAADVLSEVAGDTIRKFGISLGDIVSDNLQDYSLLNSAFASIGMPIYNIAGNHDINYDADEDRDSDETFEKMFGPATHAFQYADAHFILLDNVIFNGKKNSGGKSYIGGLRDDQFTFIN